MMAEEEQEHPSNVTSKVNLNIFSHWQNRRIFCLQTNFHAAIGQKHTFEIHEKGQ